MSARCLAHLLSAMALSGCGPSVVPSFDSPEPAARNAAIVHAAADRDRASIPELVRMLESDDPATRLLAITALERLTGETRGFDYAASPFEREQAVARWQNPSQPGESR